MSALIGALAPVHWPLLVLVTARVAGVVLIAPLWSLSTVPTTLRGAIAIALALVLLPGVPDVSVTVDPIGMLVPLATQLLIGLAIGVTATVFLAAVAMACEVITLQMGLSLGAALGGDLEMGSPGIGQLEGQFSLAVYVAVGGHVALIGALARSFQEMPIGGTVAWVNGGKALLPLFGDMFSLAVVIAAPVMVALLATNIGLAVLNRAVPQLNTMMVAVPITVGIGLITVGLSLPYTAGFVTRWASSIGGSANVVLHALTPLAGHP